MKKQKYNYFLGKLSIAQNLLVFSVTFLEICEVAIKMVIWSHKFIKNDMDLLLVLLGFISMIIGVFGSFLPVLPGLSSCWVGLLLLYLTKAVENNYWVLGITFLVMLTITILDYVIPSKGTKKFGGSSYGVWGTNIGLIIGILSPLPFGMIIGPFVGAFFGELLYDSTNHKRALKAATGSLLGFLASSFINFLFSVVYLGIFVNIVWEYRNILF